MDIQTTAIAYSADKPISTRSNRERRLTFRRAKRQTGILYAIQSK